MVVGLPWVYSCKWINHPPPRSPPTLSYRTGFQMMKELIPGGEKPQLANQTNRTSGKTEQKTKRKPLEIWCRLVGGGTTYCEEIFVKIGFIFSKGVQFQHERYLKTPPGHPPRNFFHGEKPSTPSSNHGKTQWEQKRSKSISISASEAPTLSLTKTPWSMLSGKF